MSWKRPVGICVLAIMAVLPVSGTLCTMLCDSAPSSTALASGHHHGAKPTAESARASSEAEIQGVSEHDCSSHDAAFQQASTTAAERADWSGTSIPLVTTAVAATVKGFTELGRRFEYTAPPGTAPPTTTPLVLRV